MRRELSGRDQRFTTTPIDAHFHGLTAPTFVQEEARICAPVLLSFAMLSAASKPA
jgi:hypothetical protein